MHIGKAGKMPYSGFSVRKRTNRMRTKAEIRKKLKAIPPTPHHFKLRSARDAYAYREGFRDALKWVLGEELR